MLVCHVISFGAHTWRVSPPLPPTESTHVSPSTSVYVCHTLRPDSPYHHRPHGFLYILLFLLHDHIHTFFFFRSKEYKGRTDYNSPTGPIESVRVATLLLLYLHVRDKRTAKWKVPLLSSFHLAEAVQKRKPHHI